MVTLHEVITFLVSMQISISSLQTHNVNRCGRSRHLARKLSLRRKRSSPNVFEMAATETITSIILIKLIRVSLGTVRHPRRFKIVVIDIQITLKQMLRDFIGIRVNRAKKSGMVNITSSVNSRERSGINTILHELNPLRSEERFSRNAETDLVCRLLLEKKKDRRFAVGEVVAQEGPLAAAADTLEIELVVSGAHRARPHEAADPIVGAAALIGALQTIVARRVNPAYPAVVSVGSVRAGSAPNVIPDRATLTGTLRATDPDTRRLLVEEVRRIAEATAAVHRLKAKVSIELGPPPLVNPPEPAGWARRAATAVLGDAGVVPLGFVNMGGEDFAAYLERIPGCFLRIGASEPGGEPIPAHSPRFYAAEESIFVGAAVLAETARIASEAVS